jgi:hypothetical protein
MKNIMALKTRILILVLNKGHAENLSVVSTWQFDFAKVNFRTLRAGN